MKIIIAFFSIILNSAIAFGQYAEFSFDKKIVKLEAVNEGQQLQFSYTFKNTGDIPLILSNYSVECTCTKVAFSAEPINPGESGEISVSFDTKNKIGWQYRAILLYANTKKQTEEIEFRVKVINH